MRASVVTATVVCLLMGGLALAASDQLQPAAPLLAGFERNQALGQALQMRAPKPGELAEVQALADKGLAAAREAVEKNPESAEAQYALGSWLLYSFRVEQGETLRFGADNEVLTESEEHVLAGLSDDPTEGLAALQQAVELAPGRLDYVLDYAAALMDYDRSELAAPMLKSVWTGEPPAPVELRIHAALLLATADEITGNLQGAREWIYSALLLLPTTAPAVEQLRRLDARQTEELLAPPVSVEEGAGQEMEGLPMEPDMVQPEEEAPTAPTAEAAPPDTGEAAGGDAAGSGGTANDSTPEYVQPANEEPGGS